MIHEYNISFNQLQITPEEVYETMGYGSSTPEKDVVEMVKNTIEQVAAFTVPRFCYLIAEGVITHDTLTIGSQTLQTGKIIGKQLMHSEAFVLFTATVGKEFEEWMDGFKQTDDMVMQYISDSLGSCLAEKTADYLEDLLQSEISEKGWLHTNRFSPGYCEWHVSEQQKLFSLFPTPTPCGIRLTESSLMIPIKSVSGIIGVGSKVRKLDYSCGICTLERCYKKRRKAVTQSQ